MEVPISDADYGCRFDDLEANSPDLGPPGPARRYRRVRAVGDQNGDAGNLECEHAEDADNAERHGCPPDPEPGKEQEEDNNCCGNPDTPSS